MEIILKQDVKNLGAKDQMIKVKNGYANNFLFPKRLAIPATDSNKKMLAETMRQRAGKTERDKQEALKRADVLKNTVLKIPVLVGEENKIFGSVTTLQISDILKEKGYEIDRRKISLSEEIKTLGTYSAKVELFPEVTLDVKIEVVKKE